jgi:hypothetical protein
MLVPGSILLAGFNDFHFLLFSQLEETEFNHTNFKNKILILVQLTLETTNTGTTNTDTKADNDGNVGNCKVWMMNPFLGDKKKAKVAIIEFSDF